MRNFEVEVKLGKKSTISRWNIFWFTFILMFVLTIVQHFFKSPFTLTSPLPSSNQIFQRLIPKLDQKPNNYSIKKNNSFIESSYASTGDYSAAQAYAVVDFNTGDVIEEKNLSKPLPIASLTKIMTAVVALDLEKPDEQITISKKASHEEPTTIGVVENQKMTVQELLDAILLTSANDAAQAVRDGINTKYGSDIFVQAMNEKAKFLGLKNTNFANPQGFDDKDNFSTVEDLAVLTNYALKNYSVISEIVKNDYLFIPATKDHKQFDLYNWNGLLGVYPGVSGMKIGNTDDAGYTTVVVSEREGKKVIAVLLGATGVLERDLWTSEVLDSAFKKLGNLQPVQVTESDLRAKYSTWKYWN
ncbi:MAG TPA: serine hydrolase [Patescibacteria group bacterium]|nr:serine hydrolase [Patescibacteria group bacterium]